MGILIDLDDTSAWKHEVFRDYQAPIVRREGLLAGYDMYPMKYQRRDFQAQQARLPAGADRKLRKKFSGYETTNARDDGLGQRVTYKGPWKNAQLCLVPATSFIEPCYETGKNVWMEIGLVDEPMFAVQGLWREWPGEHGPEYLFTQITVNADDHALMKRMHKPQDEKRSLVIVPRDEWDDWLDCKDPEFARSFLRLRPAELMKAWPKVSGAISANGDNLQLAF
ncbi:DUF159 family protein [Rugamonas sp. FT29W]|uniref:Abasic site processing protein n=2 Tax=Rugamonas aquatica TaxID=2743357 RepID=A0A6A7N6X3_9BURK|nr:DUF159 family protein [Rugamonas aquatica]